MIEKKTLIAKYNVLSLLSNHFKDLKKASLYFNNIFKLIISNL